MTAPASRAAAAPAARHPRPTDAQLAFPLLQELQRAGGRAKPAALYDRIADRLGLSDEARAEVVIEKDGRRRNVVAHRIRWVRQRLVQRGLIDPGARGIWALTPRGTQAALNARPGLLVTVFVTPFGEAVWGRAEDALGIVEPESLDLLFSSPPYPTAKDVRKYGTMPSREWVDWMLRLAEGWRGLLKPTGSLFLNVGQTWTRGLPTIDTFIERLIIRMEDELGFHMPQRLVWHSRAKLPAPVQWVAVQRIRVKNSFEHVLWFSPTAYPKADNRRVLIPYAKSTERTFAKPPTGKVVRPSGADFSDTSFQRRAAGAIPPTVIEATPSASNDPYLRACREAGLPPHPARTPRQLAAFALDLTTTPGDRAADFFFGSGILGQEAERRGVHWLGVERSRRLLETAKFRFPGQHRLPPCADGPATALAWRGDGGREPHQSEGAAYGV